MSKNLNFNRSQYNCDNEFYTLRPDVDAIMDELQRYYDNLGIKDVMYLFPADTDDSEFVKYAISHNLVYTNFVCIGKEAWIINGNPTKHYCIVTNPPFSKLKHYFENVINMLIGNPYVTLTYIVPTLLGTYKWFEPYLNKFTYYSTLISSNYMRPDGAVSNINSMVISSIPSFKCKMLVPAKEEEPTPAMISKEDKYLQKIRYFYWMLNHNQFQLGDEVWLSPNSIQFTKWLNSIGWKLIETQNRLPNGEFRIFIWKKIK